MKLYIRAHHLLCIQGFQGYGYSEEFTKNMSKIVEILKNDQKIIINITDSCDDICKCCPNKNNSICLDKEENEKIIKMDKEVISKLDKLEYTSYHELISKINTQFTSKNDIKNLCLNCKWYEKCLWVKNIK